MRRSLVVLLWLALGATCFAQRHGGGRGFSGGHGFSRGFSGGHGYSRGFSGGYGGYHGISRGYGGYRGWSGGYRGWSGGYRGSSGGYRGWSGYRGGWYGGYGGYGGWYGWPRVSFGIGIGWGYGPWGYWPDYYCDPYPYPYVYSYPHPYPPPVVEYRSAPRGYVEVQARSADPDPAYTASLEDGRWHRFGERQEAVAARSAPPAAAAPVRTGWRYVGAGAAR